MTTITIIGAGPGGYVAAIKAAQMGAEVHMADMGKVGGTCLNVGCIPTKALLHTSAFYRGVCNGAVPGVSVSGVTLNWDGAQEQKRCIVQRLVSGVEGLLKANGVHVHRGKASLVSSTSVNIDGEGLVTSDAIIIATGSEPVRLQFAGADLPLVIDSTQALDLDHVPASLTIIGGGVIGVEFATLFADLGTKVSVVEMLDEILPPCDGQVATLAHKFLAKRGIAIYTSAKVTSISPGGVTSAETPSGKIELSGELVLMAVGRKPVLPDGLGRLGIACERGAIKVDDNFETSVKGVYAIGDCNGLLMLAHVASSQGEAAVEHILAGEHSYNPKVQPSCVYTDPEIAFVGLTEDQAKQQGFDYRCGTFSMSGNGKAMIEGSTEGFVKIIADAESEEILGAHIVGPRATDMIAEIAAVMSMEGLVDDIARVTHAHPTVSEAVCEAAKGVFGNSIHWPPSGRN
ncbi:MAG: dihydrolipoyl dehydrogenase [Propionibacteriaceae bacterium]|nr:dihydrolipoyl dehydrogenase [Propionibacteriaceae bacterium]